MWLAFVRGLRRYLPWFAINCAKSSGLLFGKTSHLDLSARLSISRWNLSGRCQHPGCIRRLQPRLRDHVFSDELCLEADNGVWIGSLVLSATLPPNASAANSASASLKLLPNASKGETSPHAMQDFQRHCNSAFQSWVAAPPSGVPRIPRVTNLFSESAPPPHSPASFGSPSAESRL
jgi:hypothetical protein